MHFLNFANWKIRRKFQDFCKNFEKIPLLQDVLRYNVIEKEECKMANVFDVAKYILQQTGRISTMKLQKLCYYSQAWSLVWDDKPLFSEEFEAWANGPVCRELFNLHKGEYSITAEDILEKNLSNEPLTREERETIDVVLESYASRNAQWLSTLTHMEAPWNDARVGIPDGAACCNIITKESMAMYYGSL